jgi:enterochelin esterase-like enzyme
MPTCAMLVRLLLLALFGFAFFAPARAADGFEPRDLRVCAPEASAGGYAATCKQPLSPAEVQGRLQKLKDRDFAFDFEGDALLIAARIPAASVPFERGPFVCCDIQAYLDKVAPDTYAAKLRWNRMAEALLDLRLLGMKDRPQMAVRRNGSTQFLLAEPGIDKRLADAAGFTVTTTQVDTRSILGLRKVTIAAGPACRSSLAHCSVIYMPDGESTLSFVLNALGNKVDMRSVVVVGIHNADEDPSGNRNEELLFGLGPRYDVFLRFVTEDLTRHVEGGQKPLRRIAAGFSNGGAWALDVLVAKPDRFDGAIIMSPAQWQIRSAPSLAGRRVMVGAGFMETAFHANATAIAARLKERGADVKELYVPSGHSINTWVNVWNAAIVSLAYDAVEP